MINEMIIYLLKASMVFSLLFIPFLMLKNDTFFTRNRIYLLLSLFVSLVIPFLQFESSSLPINKNIAFVLEEVNINASTEILAENISFMNLVSYLFIIVTSFFILRFIFSVIKIYQLILKNSKEKSKTETIVWLNDGGDFSFFKYVFLIKEKYHPYILEHERVHVRKGHSFDILFFELFKCFQWFNPFVWIAVKEIKSQHEYAADAIASMVNKNEYQALLLSSVLGANLVPMTNSFNCLTVKKRFKMMNKKRSNKWSAAKLLIVFPFALLTLGMFAKNVNLPTSFLPKIEEKKGGGDENVVQPQYKGGMEALITYLQTNIKYPEKAKKDNVTGKVLVTFVVSKKGKITKAKVAQSVSPELDAEALRVVKSMPDWTPGTSDGKAADIEMALPIQFQL